MKTKRVTAVTATLAGIMTLTVTTAQGAVIHKGATVPPVRQGGPARSANPFGLTPQDAALMKAQEPLVAAANRFQKLGESDPTSGWAGAAVDAAGGTVTVYWHGALPAAAEKEAASDRAAGVKVVVVKAAASRKDFQKEIDRLFAKATAAGSRSSADPEITGMGIADDFSGIAVSVSPRSAAGAVANAAANAAAVAAVADTDLATVTRGDYPILSTAAVPLSFSAVGEPVSDASRQADTPAFDGGGETIGSAGQECTLGFSVWNGSQHGLLTAAHCGWDDFSTGANRSIGRTSQITYSYDEQFIPANSGFWLWDGTSIADTSGSGQFVKEVVGNSPVFNGQWLCFSGAFSGAVCNIQVKSNPVTLKVEDMDGQQRAATLWTTEKVDHTAAEGSGDSGGPAFALTNGNTQDIAVGLITMHDSGTNVACNGVPSGNSQWASGRTCGWRSYISSADDAAAAMGLSGVGS